MSYQDETFHQPGEPTTNPRARLIGDLLDQMETMDTAYMAGEIERDKWQGELSKINDRLSVAGLALTRFAHKPPF